MATLAQVYAANPATTSTLSQSDFDALAARYGGADYLNALGVKPGMNQSQLAQLYETGRLGSSADDPVMASLMEQGYLAGGSDGLSYGPKWQQAQDVFQSANPAGRMQGYAGNPNEMIRLMGGNVPDMGDSYLGWRSGQPMPKVMATDPITGMNLYDYSGVTPASVGAFNPDRSGGLMAQLDKFGGFGTLAGLMMAPVMAPLFSGLGQLGSLAFKTGAGALMSGQRPNPLSMLTSLAGAGGVNSWQQILGLLSRG